MKSSFENFSVGYNTIKQCEKYFSSTQQDNKTIRRMSEESFYDIRYSIGNFTLTVRRTIGAKIRTNASTFIRCETAQYR